MIITEALITWAVVIVGLIAVGLMALLTVKIYMSEEDKQVASVEKDADIERELLIRNRPQAGH